MGLLLLRTRTLCPSCLRWLSAPALSAPPSLPLMISRPFAVDARLPLSVATSSSPSGRRSYAVKISLTIPAGKSGTSEDLMTLEQYNLTPAGMNKPYGQSSGIKAKLIGMIQKQFTSKEIRTLLMRSAAQLYYDCANNTQYIALHKEFGLEDNFYVWYRLTILHIWLALCRVQPHMECSTYSYFLSQMMMAFNKDAHERWKIVYPHNTLERKREIKIWRYLMGILHVSMYEYDDGFLGSDQYLAGAVWRAMYLLDKEIDPIYINRLVRYIRASLFFLEKIEAEKLLTDGLDNWGPADEIALEQQQRI